MSRIMNKEWIFHESFKYGEQPNIAKPIDGYLYSLICINTKCTECKLGECKRRSKKVVKCTDMFYRYLMGRYFYGSSRENKD
jgi:hypothetical protein